MSRSVHTLLVLAAIGAAPYRAQAEDVEEAQGDDDTAIGARTDSAGQTLAERIPSVTRRVFVKEGRVELYPALGMSLSDPFFSHLVVSGGLNYHLMESLAIGVSADYYAAFASDIQVSGGGNSSGATYTTPAYAARLDAQWAPIYGKLSLFAESILHFDTYVLVGAGVLGDSSSGTSFAGSVGIGQRYYANEWMAVRVELRDQMFQMERFSSAATSSGKGWESLLSLSIAVCFYLPSSFERENL